MCSCMYCIGGGFFTLEKYRSKFGKVKNSRPSIELDPLCICVCFTNDGIFNPISASVFFFRHTPRVFLNISKTVGGWS